MSAQVADRAEHSPSIIHSQPVCDVRGAQKEEGEEAISLLSQLLRQNSQSVGCDPLGGGHIKPSENIDIYIRIYNSS